VAAALDLAPAAAQQHDGQVMVRVRIRVAEAAAVDDHGMIEQVAVAVGCRFQLVQPVGEGLDQVGVDLGDVIDLDRIVLMMGDGMVAVGDADVAIAAIAAGAWP